jgi:hypothetical protein
MQKDYAGRKEVKEEGAGRRNRKKEVETQAQTVKGLNYRSGTDYQIQTLLGWAPW